MIKTKCLAKQLINSSLTRTQFCHMSTVKNGCLRNFYHKNHRFSYIATKTNGKELHTSPIHQNEGNKRVKTKIFTISNPFKFFSLKIKLFLMRSYFDQKFTEAEFLIGARQAVLFITEKIASGNFTDLEDVMTLDGLQCARNLFNSNYDNISNLIVEDSDIMKISLHDIGFEYGESGQKWAYALIICYCSGKNSFTKTKTEDFNIEIMTSQPRILKASFCREYTPGITASWRVDMLDYKNMLKI